MTKSVHGGDVVDGSGLRAMVTGDKGLEWISPVKVLTINLFSASCFYHNLQLAMDVGRVFEVAFPGKTIMLVMIRK
ncbi:hypothetical protein J1N35_044658 [Gossypium stocksii]|uniref:Uncharacterized protein n=1 Tax=Gossypium stocksii TaxID=47602 RepID=A0A9D3U9N1_9ROSI|nr:hypothetical protein J1N35_044658 [Gossypium stocksii]